MFREVGGVASYAVDELQAALNCSLARASLIAFHDCPVARMVRCNPLLSRTDRGDVCISEFVL